MNNEVIVSLIKRGAPQTSDINEVTYTETSREVFAIQKSVRQSEFFQAAAIGFKPEITLEIFDFEYDGEELCAIGEEYYRIYRSYGIPNCDRMELYLTALAGEANEFAQFGEI